MLSVKRMFCLVLMAIPAVMATQFPVCAAEDTTPSESKAVTPGVTTSAGQNSLPGRIPEVSAAGHIVMRLRTQAGGQKAEERAYNLQQRLGPILLLPNLNVNDIKVTQQKPGETATITVRNLLLVTIDPELARANKTTVEGLADEWVSNLRQILPQVNVKNIKASTTTGTPTVAPTTAAP